MDLPTFKLSLNSSSLHSRFAFNTTLLLATSSKYFTESTRQDRGSIHFDLPASLSMAEFLIVGGAHYIRENLSININ